MGWLVPPTYWCDEVLTVRHRTRLRAGTGNYASERCKRSHSTFWGRCFSSVDEFLIPARRRGKEGERGKGRREKKEERDMRQTNYENNSIYIFKMLRHLLTLFLCWLLYFYHQPTGCSCVLYAQLESLYLFIFVVSIILYYLPIFSLYLWFYISYLLFYKYLVLFIIVIYVVSYRLLSLTICNIFRFIYVHS